MESPFKHPDRFGQWLGYRVNHLDREKHIADVGLDIREDHLSSAGNVHGGVVAAFLDFSFGAAVFSTLKEDESCSTVELKVNYLRSIQVGDKLRAVATVVFRGNRLCVLHAMLYKNDEDQATAMATATFNIVTPKASRPHQ